MKRRSFLKGMALLYAIAMSPTLAEAEIKRVAIAPDHWNAPWTRTQLFVRKLFTPLRAYRRVRIDESSRPKVRVYDLETRREGETLFCTMRWSNAKGQDIVFRNGRSQHVVNQACRLTKAVVPVHPHYDPDKEFEQETARLIDEHDHERFTEA